MRFVGFYFLLAMVSLVLAIFKAVFGLPISWEWVAVPVIMGLASLATAAMIWGFIGMSQDFDKREGE